MNRFANAVILLILAAACYGMWRMPGPDLLASKGGARPVRAEVVSTENSSVTDHGLLRFGTQHMTVRMPDGSLRAAANELRSQAEFDKMFAPGDAALVIVPAEDDGTSPLIARDHWRLGWTAALFGAFCLLLCVFGGWTGVKALFSFVFSCFAVWKLLIPLCLRGWSASGVAFLTVAVEAITRGFTNAGLSAEPYSHVESVSIAPSNNPTAVPSAPVMRWSSSWMMRSGGRSRSTSFTMAFG